MNMPKSFAKALVVGTCIFATLMSVGCSKSDKKSTPVLQVAVTPTNPPMLFEENGQIVGVDLDIFKGFCESRGCTFTMKSYNFQEMLDAVANGQADVAFAGISITEKRKLLMDFSNPYVQHPWNLTSLKKRKILITHLDQIKKYSIGFPAGAVFADYIENEWQPKGIYSLDKVKLYPTYTEAMAALDNGSLDLVFMDSSMLKTYMNRSKENTNLQTSFEIPYADNLGFAFAKGSPIREDFNRYLAELGADRIKSYFDKRER